MLKLTHYPLGKEPQEIICSPYDLKQAVVSFSSGNQSLVFLDKSLNMTPEENQVYGIGELDYGNPELDLNNTLSKDIISLISLNEETHNHEIFDELIELTRIVTNTVRCKFVVDHI